MGQFQADIAKSAYAGLAATVLLVVGICAASILNHRQTARDFERVVHTKAVQADIARFLSALKDAETGQRGFLATSEPLFFDDYKAALPHVGERLRRLAEMTADDPKQQARVADIRELAKLRLASLQETAELTRSGRREEAFAVVAAGGGERLMDRIRAAAAEMDAHEAELLGRRAARVRRAAVANVVSMSAGVALILLTALLVGLKMRRDMAARRAAEAARERVEAQLRQSQKMEAVGQLAGGVAHDFNNLLTAILGFTDLVIEKFERDDPVRGDLAEIQRAAQQAADLTGQLLAFSRRQVLQVAPVDLNDVVRAVGKLLRRVIGENIRLVTQLKPGVGTIMADAGQLKQIVLNLAVNARDAMPEGGQLTIETGEAELDEEYAATHAEVTPGRYAMLAVSDNGVGIPEEIRERIFEPFFTTKELGKGTGLGLSTVHGVVKQSGGHVWVYSEVGRGTTFRIYFPRVDAPARPVAFEDAEEARALRGTETILLVEDEPAVRRVAREALERRGYTVLAADSPAQALEMAAALGGGRVDLLITDVVMPGMNGPQVAERLREGRPGLPVLYISGYTENAVGRHGVVDAEVHFLPKPFVVRRFLRKVREILDAPASKA